MAWGNMVFAYPVMNLKGDDGMANSDDLDQILIQVCPVYSGMSVRILKGMDTL